MTLGSSPGLTGCQTLHTLQCHWLHKLVYTSKILVLPSFVWTILFIHASHENHQKKLFSSLADFPLGKGVMHNNPSPLAT